jgi:carboxypeptidase Taq
MTVPPAYETLHERLAAIHDLVEVGGLLAWDQQTIMPPLGSEVRAQQLATIGRLAHEQFVDDEIGTLLDELAPWAEELPYESDEASLVRMTRRDFDKATRVPPALTAEMSRTGSLSFGVWVEARGKSDYESFRPWLEQMIELKHRYVDCFPPADDPYDTLLDDYEPGMETAQVREIFAGLREELVPLVEAAGSSATPRVAGRFDPARQRELSLEIVRRFGYDDEAWRMDTAPHPFASSLGTQDIRITTREPDDSLDGLFATMHECGHGLYEHGVSPALERTPLARGASLGLHESQSRLWENLVGRSRPFWSWFYPRLREAFPSELANVDEETWLYFPTYSLSNVMSAQIWDRMRDDVSDVDEQMARGEFGAIREWLRSHLHVHGRKFMPADTLVRVVGGPIDPEPYLRYLQGKLAVA